MRICLVTCEYPPLVGGMGQSVFRIAHAISSHTPHEVDVASFENLWESYEHTLSGKESVHPNGPAVHRFRVSSEARGDPSASVYRHLAELHATVGFDVFVAFELSKLAHPTTSLAKDRGIPSVVSVRCDGRVAMCQHEGCCQIRHALEDADEVVTINRDALNTVSTVCYLKTPGVAIPNHIAPSEYRGGFTPRLPLDPKTTVIATAGVFRPQKGLEFFLEAIASLPSAGRLPRVRVPHLGGTRCQFGDPLGTVRGYHTGYPLGVVPGVAEHDVTVLLIGDARLPDQQYFQDLLSAYTHHLKIIITGFVDHWDILSYLRLADIFVMSSLSEGGPNTVLEAMLASVPVIATRVGFVPEVIQHGANGMVVAPGSAGELSAALRQLIDDLQLRRRLAEGGRQTVALRFSPEQEAAKWSSVFESVAGRL